MSLIKKETAIADLLMFTPKIWHDERGFFFESFNERDFEQEIGYSPRFVQTNHSYSKKGVIRGLHFQHRAKQAKLVRVVTGEIFDVAVDLRPQSETFGNWFGAILSGANRTQMWVPKGFAHGFLVLSDDAHVLYSVTDYWRPEFEETLKWDDCTIAIDWPLTQQTIASKKDEQGKSFAELRSKLLED